MRIEAIQIDNLASLRGAQPAIELRGPLLGEAGLIAVTGPTGAGKTTLFDAVCLALFDETPRTRGRGRDPRELLARGAGEAQVVVELRLDDGAAWRAEWSVHRARQQADGPLQMSRQRIVDSSTGAVLAEGKKQVQALVEKRLGLSFDQFTSVVLIAQGQFAKFLEATDAERSALLERLTGTEIYSELSRAAYERARLAQEKVSELDKVAQHFAGLSGEEREALGAELTASGEQLAVEAKRVEAQSLAVRRLGDLLDLLARRQLAADQLAAATAAVTATAADERRRELAERAALAAPALDRSAELRRRRTQAATEAEARAAIAARARAELAAATTALDSCWQTLLASRQAAAAEESARRAARSLEGATLAGLRELRQQRQQKTEQALRRQDEAGEAEEEVASCLQENLAAAGELLNRRQQLESLRHEAAALVRQLESLGQGQGREFWARRRLDLQQAGDLAQQLRKLDLQALERERRVLSQAAAAKAQALEAARARLATARQQRQQHEALLRLAFGRAELAEHRPALRPGESCPLCGAQDHPWAQRPAAEDHGILRRAEADKLQQEAMERTAESAAGGAASAHQEALVAAERAKAQLESANSQVKNARGRWLELRLSLPELPVRPTDFASSELDQIDARLERFDQLLPLVAKNRQALGVAEQALSEIEKEQAIAAERLQSAERRRSEAAAALAAAGEEESLAEQQFRDRAAALAAEVGLEPPRGDDSDRFLAQLATALASWQTASERLQELEALVSRVAGRRPELIAGLPAEPRAPAPELLPQAQSAMAPARLEAALEAALRSEATCQERCRLEEDRERRAVAARLDWQTQAVAAELLLAAAVAEQQFTSEEELRGALLPAAELADLKRRLDELARERERRDARLQQIEQELEALQAEAVEPLGLEAAQSEKVRHDAELSSLKERHAEILARCIDLRARLQNENNRQAERDRLEAELQEARAAADLAARLSQLIGQKDGGKFRRFAQQLNLDLLLELANLRLERLAPRYRLARLGETLDLEVIDREMADERRPVNTLSGGESFLVSLALALALADLRRGNLRLGTLFLDEGFGSLDEDTLDTALSVLEQLQADQNTQILIISHVGALKERIDHRIDIQKLGGGRSRLQILAGQGTNR